jgi:GT2 family glycosyltransferase
VRGGGAEVSRPVAVDVLVPTCGRPAALAATLATLLGQTRRDFRLIVSDQSDDPPAVAAPEVLAVCRVLEVLGVPVELLRHRPRRGLAEQRSFLLERATAPAVLFLDDDVLCEPDLLDRLLRALDAARCGFVGSFVEAPSAVTSEAVCDVPDPSLRIDLWTGPVEPEEVVPGSSAWERRHLHFAAHLRKVGARDGLDGRGDLLYKVAWVGGCVLFDTAKLRSAGGFDFWPALPPVHVGEDVVAQQRVAARFGGAGLYPSGAWHQEVRTTMPHRGVDAPLVLPLPGRDGVIPASTRTLRG